MEKIIIETFIVDIKNGKIKKENLPSAWKEKVENAMKGE